MNLFLEIARIPPQAPPACRIRNLAKFQKTFSRGRANPYPQKYCFALPRPFLVI